MSYRRVIPQLIVGTINANGQSVSAFVENYSTVAMSMVAASLVGHTIVFEISNDAKLNPDTGEWDGTSGTWYSVLAQRTSAVTQESGGTSLAATPAYGWIVPVVGWRFLRVRATAHTSGSATWTLLSDDSPAALAPNNGTVNVTALASAASGGISTVARLPTAAASTNATSVKGSAGRVYFVDCVNASAAMRFLKLYNKATAPTVGTDTPFATFAIPAGQRLSVNWADIGLYLSAGIAYAFTTGAPDADTGALTANDIVGLNVGYS